MARRRQMISRRKRPKTRAQQMMEQTQRRKRPKTEYQLLQEEAVERAKTRKTIQGFESDLVNIEQDITKLTRNQIFKLLGRISKEAQAMRDLSNDEYKIPRTLNWQEYRRREEILTPFQQKVQEQTGKDPQVKPLVRAEKQKRKKTIKLKEEKTEDLRDERIPQPRATRASIQFDQHRGIRGLMGSSFINYLDYEPETKVVNVRLGYRNYHTTKEVPQSVFSRWKRGEATCQTNDKSSLKRWTIGKTPSLGAFFNVFIKGRYGLVRGLA